MEVHTALVKAWEEKYPIPGYLVIWAKSLSLRDQNKKEKARQIIPEYPGFKYAEALHTQK